MIPGGRLKLVPADAAALLAQHVYEHGALQSELCEARAKIRRVETLRELIRKHFEKEPAAKAFEARGARFFATLGPRAWQSSVDYDAVIKAVGLRAYVEIARPTLKILGETLAPDVLARVVTQDYTGARPLKTFEIG